MRPSGAQLVGMPRRDTRFGSCRAIGGHAIDGAFGRVGDLTTIARPCRIAIVRAFRHTCRHATREIEHADRAHTVARTLARSGQQTAIGRDGRTRVFDSLVTMPLPGPARRARPIQTAGPPSIGTPTHRSVDTENPDGYNVGGIATSRPVIGMGGPVMRTPELSNG